VNEIYHLCSKRNNKIINYYYRQKILNNLLSEINCMKKVGIYIMSSGLIITIITAVFYFLKLDQHVMDRFVLTIGKSYHFNWAPMIGISVMAFGEFILWESQYCKNLNEVNIKFIYNFRLKISNIRLGLIYLSNRRLLNLKVIKFLISIFLF